MGFKPKKGYIFDLILERHKKKENILYKITTQKGRGGNNALTAQAQKQQKKASEPKINTDMMSTIFGFSQNEPEKKIVTNPQPKICEQTKEIVDAIKINHHHPLSKKFKEVDADKANLNVYMYTSNFELLKSIVKKKFSDNEKIPNHRKISVKQVLATSISKFDNLKLNFNANDLILQKEMTLSLLGHNNDTGLKNEVQSEMELIQELKNNANDQEILVDRYESVIRMVKDEKDKIEKAISDKIKVNFDIKKMKKQKKLKGKAKIAISKINSRKSSNNSSLISSHRASINSPSNLLSPPQILDFVIQNPQKLTAQNQAISHMKVTYPERRIGQFRNIPTLEARRDYLQTMINNHKEALEGLKEERIILKSKILQITKDLLQHPEKLHQQGFNFQKVIINKLRIGEEVQHFEIGGMFTKPEKEFIIRHSELEIEWQKLKQNKEEEEAKALADYKPKIKVRATPLEVTRNSNWAPIYATKTSKGRFMSGQQAVTGQSEFGTVPDHKILIEKLCKDPIPLHIRREQFEKEEREEKELHLEIKRKAVFGANPTLFNHAKEINDPKRLIAIENYIRDQFEAEIRQLMKSTIQTSRISIKRQITERMYKFCGIKSIGEVLTSAFVN